MTAAGRAACALLSASAHAADLEGYARVGNGDVDEARRTCYNLGISGGHYRLGNECDNYAEIGVAHTIQAQGFSVRGLVMANVQSPGRDGSGSTGGIEQLYVEGRGAAFAPEVGFWLGKRFYGRADVHILDTKFVRLDGAGFGADGIGLGTAKLGVAFFRLEATSGAPFGAQPSERPAHRVNLDLTRIGFDGFGELRFTAAFTRGHDDPLTGAGGTHGFALSAQYDAAWPAIGAANTTWLQFARGSAGLDANFGTMTAAPAVAQWRVVESLTWQDGAFGGQAVALYGQHDADPSHRVAARYTERSIGARGSYALAPHVKLLAEAGFMDKRPVGAERQRLTKFTLAVAWSTGPRWSDRPELRLYATTARWNDAANDAGGAGGLTGLGDGATRGTSWGVQFEHWF